MLSSQCWMIKCKRKTFHKKQRLPRNRHGGMVVGFTQGEKIAQVSISAHPIWESSTKTVVNKKIYLPNVGTTYQLGA